jgi:hypothetical protein
MKFEIEEFRSYVELNKSFLKNFYFINWYLEKENIFLIFNINIINFSNNIINNKKLFKLENPIRFNSSEYLMTNFFKKNMKMFFDSNDIYLGFIEKWDNPKDDLIYFTKWYTIKA